MTIRRFVKIVPLVLILVGCSNRDSISSKEIESAPQPGVVGGRVVEASSPLKSFVVQVRRYTDRSQNLYYTCSGVIIANDTVLTAAHCFVDDPRALQATIALGVDANQPTDERTIKAFAIHPGYNTQQEIPFHDLALVKFAPAFSAATSWPKIVLKTPPVGTRVDFAGYGLTTYDLSSFGQPLHLRTTSFRLSNIIPRFNELDVTMGAAAGISRGDSGGPLLLPTTGGWDVLGTAADMTFTSSSATASFTLVAPHFAWIQKTIPVLRGMK